VNWIGKSEGAELKFSIINSQLSIKVFTTRPDTLYGATFLVVSPESEWVEKVTTKDQQVKVSNYVKEHSFKDQVLKDTEVKEKTGVFTGSYAVNPATGREIPIWVSDYVLSGYGSGGHFL